MRYASAEALESALRVAHTGDSDDPYYEVEEIPHRLAPPGLPYLYVGACECPGSDGDVGTGLDRIYQVLDFFYRRLKIGVGEDYILAPCLQYTAAYGVTLAVIEVVYEHVKRCPLRGPSASEFEGSVIPAVDNDDDLAVP